MKNGFFTANNQGVTSIVPPLKAGDRIGLIRQQIDDLAFAFITPLGARG